jgi:hypothetical protein
MTRDAGGVWWRDLSGMLSIRLGLLVGFAVAVPLGAGQGLDEQDGRLDCRWGLPPAEGGSGIQFGGHSYRRVRCSGDVGCAAGRLAWAGPLAPFRSRVGNVFGEGVRVGESCLTARRAGRHPRARMARGNLLGYDGRTAALPARKAGN